MIRKAITQSQLSRLGIEVFAQGSFRNVTNIPQESDVDVSVCLLDSFYFQLPEGASASDANITTPATQKYPDYKDAVAAALDAYFKDGQVRRGNKAIRIHSNTYRVDADVVPNWEYRDYFYNSNGILVYRSGVRFWADDGSVITNWPKQHIEEGIAKNARTKRRFKRMARILKSLQVEMLEQGVIKQRLPSFLIESLVFNVPDDYFGDSEYRVDVRKGLAHIFNNTRPGDDASKWTEVNDVKYLFHGSQPWMKAQAHSFVSMAWDYIGFE